MVGARDEVGCRSIVGEVVTGREGGEVVMGAGAVVLGWMKAEEVAGAEETAAEDEDESLDEEELRCEYCYESQRASTAVNADNAPSTTLR